MSLTFEQLAPIFHICAARYQNNKYDHWELIDAVWAKGEVQNLDDIRLTRKAIEYDIIDYIREREGRPARARLTSLDDAPDIQSEERVRDIDNKDELECVYKSAGLDNKERQIINWYHIEGFTQQEIARDLGCTEANINQRLKRIMIRLKAAAKQQST